MNSPWNGSFYQKFRLFFGCYLLIHFLQLVPWGKELFSNEGLLKNAALSPIIFAFPNILGYIDSSSFVLVFLLIGALASVFFAIGIADRLAAIIIWYVLACCLGRNPLIANPSLPFVGWILLAHACCPKLPPWYERNNAASLSWQMPEKVYLASWIVMSLGYSYSGYTKLDSPSWIDGSAIQHVLQNPLARPIFFKDYLLKAPIWILQIMTWGILLLELLFAPLALLKQTRSWVWGCMLIVHISLFGLMNFADLTMGMVILHLFTFDTSWSSFISKICFKQGKVNE